MLTRSCMVLVLVFAACRIPPDIRFHDGTPVKLAFIQQPTTGITEQPLDPIIVAITDEQGAPVASAQHAITLALRDNPTGANLLGSLTVAAIGGGAASFALVGLDRRGSGYTLEASAAGLAPATSASFDVAAPAFALVSTGIPGGSISSVAVSPAPAGGTTTVFAATGNGAYRSVDGGATWTPASFGLAGGAGTIVPDPRSPGVAYVVKGVGGYGFVGGERYFVRKTVSGGAAWFDAGTTAALGEGASVAVDPADPAIVYAGGSNLFRSANGGATWNQLRGFPFECPVVAVDPTTTTTIYCTAFDRATATWRGVYRSSDSGATWAAINNGLPSLTTQGPLLATPEALFVGANGLYRSTDAGATWLPVQAAGVALAYAPALPSRLYVSQGALGVSVSSDAGASFADPVFVGDLVQSLAVDPTNPDRVYAAGRDNGVYVSTNGGVSWSFSSLGISARSVRSVAIAPGAPDTVVVSTQFAPLSSTNGVFQTTDGGERWRQTSSDTGIVVFDRSTAARAYLCGDSFAASTDSGASFAVAGTTGTGCTQLAFSGTTFLAAGYPGGLRRSSDGGETWAATGLGEAYTYGVALGDGAGSVVVTGSDHGIYRSIDGGASFAPPRLELAKSILADPTTATRVIAGLECGSANGGVVSNGGFRVSTDGGESFGDVIPGPCVAQLGDNGTTLYAAGRNYSAFSTDHGATWQRLGAIPSGIEATSIAASGDGRTIYLGTIGGLYKSTSGGL